MATQPSHGLNYLSKPRRPDFHPLSYMSDVGKNIHKKLPTKAQAQKGAKKGLIILIFILFLFIVGSVIYFYPNLIALTKKTNQNYEVAASDSSGQFAADVKNAVNPLLQNYEISAADPSGQFAADVKKIAEPVMPNTSGLFINDVQAVLNPVLANYATSAQEATDIKNLQAQLAPLVTTTQEKADYNTLQTTLSALDTKLTNAIASSSPNTNTALTAAQTSIASLQSALITLTNQELSDIASIKTLITTSNTQEATDISNVNQNIANLQKLITPIDDKLPQNIRSGWLGPYYLHLPNISYTTNPKQDYSQLFRNTDNTALSGSCFDIGQYKHDGIMDPNNAGSVGGIYGCIHGDTWQQFYFNNMTGQLYNVKNQKCLAVDDAKTPKKFVWQPCNSLDPKQHLNRNSGRIQYADAYALDITQPDNLGPPQNISSNNYFNQQVNFIYDGP